nr:hypothetical protein [Tanacetum cinerariifolium]
MGYDKPSTKLTFYKAFFSAQSKFLIHTILQCMSAKRTSWNEFSSSMALAVICLATGRKFNFLKYIFDSLVRNVDSSSKFYMYPRFLELMINAQIADSSHNTKYTSPALTQKVFPNMRRVGKGFSRVDTLLFEGMLVPQQVQDDIDVVAEDEDVAPTPPPLPHQSLIAQPSLPPQQQPLQPLHPTDISMDLLNILLETCTTLTRKVENLEQDKIAQALEITNLKQRVRKLEKKKKLKDFGVKRLRKDDKAEPAELKEVIEVVTTTKLMLEVVTTAATNITAAPMPKASAARRRKGVVIRDPEETSTPSVIVHSEPKERRKCVRIRGKQAKQEEK